MRDSYTVTLPEEPPVLPDLHKELRPRTSMPGSLLVSTFVGLVLNKTKVRAARRMGAEEGTMGRGNLLCALESAEPPGAHIAARWGAWHWVHIDATGFGGWHLPGREQEGR